MRGFSVGRAVRYQWVTAAAVLLCTFLSTQYIKSNVIARFPAASSHALAKILASILPPYLASRLLIVSVHSNAALEIAADAPLFSLEADDTAKAPSPTPRLRGDSDLARLKVRRQDLAMQIAGETQFLAALPEGEPIPVMSSTAPRVVTTSRGISSEEALLRKQVNEARAHLDLLRTTDTDLHPDVIEARESLAKVQSQLSAVQRQAEAAMQAVPPPIPPSQEISIQPANASSQRLQAMQEIANLIHAEARVDERLKEAELLSNPMPAGRTAIESEVYKKPSLAGTATLPFVKSEQAPAELSKITKTAAYEFCCIALSFLFAIVAACLVETFQDHVPGADALHELLPEHATFFGAVPRMRKS